MPDFLEFYRSITPAISAETGASDSLLHVHAGMAILFAARLITRRSLATWLPVTIVLVIAIVKEVLDVIVNGMAVLPDSLLDIVNTVFWPAALMLGLRWRMARG